MKTTARYLGTDLTRRHQETKKSETFQEVLQLFHEVSYSGAHPFEDFLDHLASDAENELRKRGLSCEWKTVLQQLKDEDYDSIVGYSARFLKLIASLKGRLQRGEADADALQKAYELGELLHEAKFKQRYEKPAISGAKSRLGGKKGGIRNAAFKKKDNDRRDVEMAREFLSGRKGDRSQDAALKRRIGKQRGLKRSASISAINHGMELLSSE